MDELRFPTWADVGMPDAIVQMLKNIRSDALLEQVIFEKVFHNVRRLQYTYTCGVCGHQYKAQKTTDDYATCEKCKSRAIRVTQYLRNWSRPHPPGSCNVDIFASEVLQKMRGNFFTYFKIPFQAEDIVLFRWRQDGFVAQFQGGDVAEEPNTSRALCKASILVPFLWDANFDWKTCRRRPTGRLKPLIPTLYEWVQRG